jgi:hypothetical protein
MKPLSRRKELMIASAGITGDMLQPRTAGDPSIERVLDSGHRKASRATESILVATDFSEGAARALERAVLLTNEVAPARLTLLHADSASPCPHYCGGGMGIANHKARQRAFASWRGTFANALEFASTSAS